MLGDIMTWHLRFEGAETNLGFKRCTASRRSRSPPARVVRVHATLDGSRALDGN